MLNEVRFIGNLGKDPEIKKLSDGTPVAKISVATSESYKDKNGEWQKTTEWHDVVLWRNLAERAERDLKKGKQVLILGKLTHRSYEDKDGIKRYVSEVVANTFRILGRKEEGEGGQPVLQPAPTTLSTATDNADDAASDDLPF